MVVLPDHFADLLIVGVIPLTLYIKKSSEQERLQRFIAFYVIGKLEEIDLSKTLKLNLNVCLQNCLFLIRGKL